MQTNARRLLIASALTFAACGGGEAGPAQNEYSAAEGEHAGGESPEEGAGHEHAGMPAEVEAFHGALAPAWHSAPGESRSAEACRAAPALVERARAVVAAPAPTTVDQAAWGEAIGSLLSSSEALAAECDAQGSEAEAALSRVHDAFHSLVDQLAADRH